MTESHNRRDFLAAATASVMAPSGARSPADSPSSSPIVDTHVHLWDLSRFRLGWLEPGSPLHRNFQWDDYREATRAWTW
jgi:L-fuconolactonase